MEVTKGVHLLPSTRGSYVYLVLGEEPVLIDTSLPGRATAILAELEAPGLLNEVKHFSFAHVCTAHGEPVQRGNLWETLVERI